MGEIDNIQLENGKYLNVKMPIYYLLDYSNSYLKKIGSFLQYYINEAALNNDNDMFDFVANNTTDLYKFKAKSTPAETNTEENETVLPLKYLRNF